MMRQTVATISRLLESLRDLSSRMLLSTHAALRIACMMLCAPLRWIVGALLFTGAAMLGACVLVIIVLMQTIQRQSTTDNR